MWCTASIYYKCEPLPMTQSYRAPSFGIVLPQHFSSFGKFGLLESALLVRGVFSSKTTARGNSLSCARQRGPDKSGSRADNDIDSKIVKKK